MNPVIYRLHSLMHQSSKRILGLMSGTSLDGLDIALCTVYGSGKETKVILEAFQTFPYQQAFKERLQQFCFQENNGMRDLTLLNQELGYVYAQYALQALDTWGVLADDIDLIASHGQTIYHFPGDGKDERPATFQIGDGDHIAHRTGIITISDFRQKHLVAGGAGAPLAVYGDYLLFSHPTDNRILLNIGGIANLTYIPQNANFADVVCTDIGPGNALLDAWLHYANPSMHMDLDGKLALKGAVHTGLLEAMSQVSFFKIPFPKTTGKELFNVAFVQQAMATIGIKTLPIEDMLATLCALSVSSILQAIQKICPDLSQVTLITSGGGIHHPLLMEGLKKGMTPAQVLTTDAWGINPDAKESVLFAILANETICGDVAVFAGHPYHPPITTGKISLPK